MVPRSLKFMMILGVVMAFSAILAPLTNALEIRYGITSAVAYYALFPGVLIYGVGGILVFKKLAVGLAFLLVGWMINSWCIYTFMAVDLQELYFPGFVFLSGLGLFIFSLMFIEKDFRRWFSE